MNKKEFIKTMATEMNAPRAEADKAYEAFVNAIAAGLNAGEKVQLAGFGTFEMRDMPARVGINPRTQQKVDVPAGRKPVLRFGKAFKDKIR